MKESPYLSFEPCALDAIMPMHIMISPTGHITRVGPTMAKLRPDMEFSGKRLLEVFELRRPHGMVQNMEKLRSLAGARLRLNFRSAPTTSLKGILIPAGDKGEMVLNLSFGISVVTAVRDYRLTNRDFAPTDLTVEMLYLHEAKSAVMEESRNLNARLQIERDKAEARALTDTLTGLHNRRAMDQKLAAAAAGRGRFGLMNLDLDYFKDVNDTLGHAAGDFVLQRVAEILAEETRSCDLVARVGGDEFVLILDGLTQAKDLLAIANRIVDRLEEPMEFEGKPCRISGSVGIVSSTLYEAPDPERMLSDADLALYSSKHQGRGRATVISPELRKGKPVPPTTQKRQPTKASKARKAS